MSLRTSRAARRLLIEFFESVYWPKGAQGNLAIAEEHFNEVAANDYSFRDVAERLRQLSQKPEAED